MYYLQHLVWAIALGSTVVQAIPQPKAETPSLSIRDNGLQKRTLDEYKTINGHKTLYVPMSYVGFMHSATGEWVRYACDEAQGSSCKKQTGTVAAKAERQLGTDSLASCIDVNFISEAGSLKVHVPAHVCPLLPSHVKQPTNPATSQTSHVVYKNMQTVLKALSPEIKGLGKFAVEVVLGESGRVENIPEVLADLFGMPEKELNVGGIRQIKYKAGETKDIHSGTTRVDISTKPPKFYMNNQEITIRIA
ncbi:MAG: hypothetical protein M1820_008654 [Bogoriella megaspora]|nr:MAG: hypothetical protein M1820_008654 [Bogoriella megaspora]